MQLAKANHINQTKGGAKMSERELKFERKLAMHTAPTLLGIKCAGLL